MEERPELKRGLAAVDFCEFYYLKTELAAFCRENGLPAGGSKAELTRRVACYLETGAAPPPQKSARAVKKEDVLLTEQTLIEEGIVCSEKHRAFFKEKLGKSFSFNVDFQKWLRANAGRTYGEALEAYGRIRKEKKERKTAIAPQFEYNTYIRDFFAENPGRTLQEAILCWKAKKQKQGCRRYEKEDLAALQGAAGPLEKRPGG